VQLLRCHFAIAVYTRSLCKQSLCNPVETTLHFPHNRLAVGYKHWALAALSLHNCCVIVTQLLRNRYTNAALSPLDCCTIALNSECYRYAIAVQSPCNRFASASQTLNNHLVITAQSLRNHFVIAAQLLRDSVRSLSSRFAIVL
jgi:hypothetical protein